jgi:hypothetical protein
MRDEGLLQRILIDRVGVLMKRNGDFQEPF